MCTACATSEWRLPFAMMEQQLSLHRVWPFSLHIPRHLNTIVAHLVRGEKGESVHAYDMASGVWRWTAWALGLWHGGPGSRFELALTNGAVGVWLSPWITVISRLTAKPRSGRRGPGADPQTKQTADMDNQSKESRMPQSGGSTQTCCLPAVTMERGHFPHLVRF